MTHIMKIDEMSENRVKRSDGFWSNRVYYQVSYDDGEGRVSISRETVNQAKLIYDEYHSKDIDGTKYPNLRLEEVGVDGSLTVLRP